MKFGFAWFYLVMVMIIGGCAAFQPAEPIDVTVAGIESLPSEGLELRMSVRLRIQNPNDRPIDYDGLSVRLIVLEKTFATGVSDQRGTIPRFGTEVIPVAVTISPLRVAWNTVGFLINESRSDKVRYELATASQQPAVGTLMPPMTPVCRWPPLEWSAVVCHQATAGQLLPLVVSPNRPSGLPQYSVTCRRADSHKSATADLGSLAKLGRQSAGYLPFSR